MPDGADVTIRYQFLPTESSIKESAEKVVRQLNKTGGSAFSKASGKKLQTEFDKTVDILVNFLRATQQKTSLQTKIMSAIKFGKEMGVPIGGGGGEAGAGGGGGGLAGSIGMLIGIMTAVSIAVLLIAGFFEAVGPLLKMFVKVVAAVFIILLAPILRRIMPVIGNLIKAIVGGAKSIAGGEEALFDNIGKLFMGEFLKPLEDLLFGVAKTVVMGLKNIIFGGLERIIFFIGDVIGRMLVAFMELGSVILTTLGISDVAFRKTISDVIIGVNTATAAAVNFIKALSDTYTTIIDAFFVEARLQFDSGFNSLLEAINLFVNGLASAAVAIGVTPGNIPSRNIPLDTIVREQEEARIKRKNSYTYGKTALDFISRPGSGIQAFSPNDTIIGMKNPGALGGTTINNYLTVSAGVDRNEFRKILSEFNREQAKGMRSKTSYVSGVYA